MIELDESRGQPTGAVFMAEVGAVSPAGATLVLPGQETATQKSYKRLASESELWPGDLVLCARVSGTYVVLGKIT